MGSGEIVKGVEKGGKKRRKGGTLVINEDQKCVYRGEVRKGVTRKGEGGKKNHFMQWGKMSRPGEKSGNVEGDIQKGKQIIQKR